MSWEEKKTLPNLEHHFSEDIWNSSSKMSALVFFFFNQCIFLFLEVSKFFEKASHFTFFHTYQNVIKTCIIII